MAGTERLILQQRDRELLRILATLRLLDHEQARTIAGFGSTSRTNKRLLKLVRAGLLRRFLTGSTGGRKALYSISEKGAQLVEVPYRGLRRPQGAMLTADFFVEHQLAINAIYCAAKHGTHPAGVHFHRWMSFHEEIVPEIRLIPDGYVEYVTPAGIIAAFIEVDLGNESLAVWREKTRKYLQLAVSGAYARVFRQSRFRVLVTAHSQRRLESLRKTIAQTTDKIFRFATFESARASFFEPIWTKPTDTKPEALIETNP